MNPEARSEDSFDLLYRTHSRRVLATLIRLLGDFDLAEEGMHEAFAEALRRWPEQGVPLNPRAWLVSTGRFKAIDSLRKKARFNAHLSQLVLGESGIAGPDAFLDDPEPADDQLRLIFTCCHPALTPEARIALTLREVCGLTTGEIARAFLVKEETLAQRIVRAKTKIRRERIPYEVPDARELPKRLEAVLRVVYLVFNEGYSASSGDSLTRIGLTDEAIRLGRLLVELLPDAEALGLLALMLFHDARRPGRMQDGELTLLEDQDRRLWNWDRIREGEELVRRAIRTRDFGSFTLQAAIAGVHAGASSSDATDWDEIVGLYDLLTQADASPVVELNRAVAMAMRDGPEVGVRMIDALFLRGELLDYYLAHASRAELCRRLGKRDEAAAGYQTALGLCALAPVRRHLERRVLELTSS